MPPINTTLIRTRATEHIAIALNNGATTFTLHNPGGFIPDEIHVSAAIDIQTPDLFEVQSNMLPNHTLCVFDGYNSYNPTSVHLNTSRQSFESTYDVMVWNVSAMGVQSTANFVMLKFDFIRYS